MLVAVVLVVAAAAAVVVRPGLSQTLSVELLLFKTRTFAYFPCRRDIERPCVLRPRDLLLLLLWLIRFDRLIFFHSRIEPLHPSTYFSWSCLSLSFFSLLSAIFPFLS